MNRLDGEAMYFGDSNDAFNPGANGSDMPLSLKWSGVTKNDLQTLGLFGGPNSRALQGMIACLFAASSVGVWVSYSRNKQFYSDKRRYLGPQYTYRRILALVDLLVSKGMIEEERASRSSFGWQSRIRATDRLLSAPLNWSSVTASEKHETIQLKNKAKHLIDYDDTDHTNAMRCRMRRHNEIFRNAVLGSTDAALDLSKPCLKLDGQIVNPGNRATYRVFNEDWQHGGRLYGAFWQHLPKYRRAQLTIDESPTVELDYAELHAQLLYACCGGVSPGRCYRMEGWDRSLVKMAWQIMINANSRPKAAKALVFNIADPDKYPDFDEYTARRLLRALELRHGPISAYFYSGVGRRLQFLDSELLLDVLDRCHDCGIVALPIHDSVIVRQDCSARVSEIMEEQLQRKLEVLRRGEHPLAGSVEFATVCEA